MFCPKCGSNQGDGRKFCTSCGTNLLVVAQALSGRLPQSYPPSPHMPPAPQVPLRDRQRELTKGLYFAIIGGGIMMGRLITFILTGFRDGPFGFWGFIGFILLAVGLAKIISYRAQTPAVIPPSPPLDSDLHQTTSQAIFPAQAVPPQPVFSANSGDGYETPRTSELEPVELPRPSITEAETQTLPSKAQPTELQE
ncbi:MAG: zinc ribbon domain-containing protein [Blastocatellia bacterium]|nr:zinc ribbon domain-containing protein [Blastocatellia bacterium]